jgi:hypothetical protein
VHDAAQLADDSAFTPATSRVMPAGYTADETATDSVDEGDIGAARMTLDRKQITTEYVHAAAGGTSVSSSISTGAVLTAVVKNSPGKVFSIQCFNLNARALRAPVQHDHGARPRRTAPTSCGAASSRVTPRVPASRSC